MNNKFFADIKNIRTAIDSNKLVVFAGAGISIDAGVPGWNTLIDEMKSDIEIPKNEQDYLRIAQMYFNDRQQKEFIDKIRFVLKHKKVRYNEIHEEIFQLNPEHLLTTNFDDLLEQVIKKRSLPFSIVSKDKEFPYALNTNLLVKVHGDLNDTDIVIKEDDFIDFSLNHPLTEAFIKSVFASKVVLFVGYSFSDIDLKMVMQNVRNILERDFQNAYMLSVDKIHPTQREYLKQKGINVISYLDAVNSDGVNYIFEYLNGNNALNKDYYKKGENLSDKGQSLLNFLRFISSYDKFNEPLTQKNIIDQIHLSLSRFSEFKSLSPDFVANLFPFNNSKQKVYNYENYSLLTKNHKLYDLFFDQIEYDNDEVKFKPPPNMNLSSEEVKEYEIKLREIISTLNRSSILYIFKENEKPDSFGNYGWSDKYRKLQIKTGEKCKCLNCRLNRLELGSVIIEAVNSAADETTSVQSDLALAFTNYKIGNFNQSYKLFEEAANKSWQAGQYFSYYIAKHNIKTLRTLITWYERTLKEEERNKILQEMEDIDFDKLLFQIPFMGETEYELLKSIRDEDILKRAEKNINNVYEKILDSYDSYKDRTKTIMGPDYPQQIYFEIFKIISFYNNNFIVADEYIHFTRICKKGIEALLISFATSSDYKEKLLEFNKLFFDIVVSYGDAKEIKTITQKYEINQLVFSKESLPEIMESINNFLKSFFVENNYFGKSIIVNKVTRNQISNNFFEEKCRKEFNNIFLLLSGIEIDKKSIENLLVNLVGFIQHETFLYPANIDYLCSFIFKHHKMFSQDNFENILKAVLSKHKIYFRESLLEVISSAFKANNYNGISNRNLIFQIFEICQSSEIINDVIVDLWSISDSAIKQELKEKIVSSLDEKFDINLYRSAAIHKIIDFNPYFVKYISEINSTKGNGHYVLVSERPNVQSLVFINAMIFIYIMKVKSTDRRLKALKDLADYMKFFLFPEQFDYKKFKIEWLFFADRKIFFERFKKIPAIKHHIEIALKLKFDRELAEIYVKYFI